MTWGDDWAAIQAQAAKAAAADAVSKRQQEQARQEREDPGLARERAVLSGMANFKLQPGQMLLLGPEAVAVLAGERVFKGKLPGAMVIEKSEWNLGDLTGSPRRGSGKMRR